MIQKPLCKEVSACKACFRTGNGMGESDSPSHIVHPVECWDVSQLPGPRFSCRLDVMAAGCRVNKRARRSTRVMYFLGEVGQSPHQRPWAAQFPFQARDHPSGVRGLGGCDPLGGRGEDKGDGGRMRRVTGVLPCPGATLPSSLACERTGSMGGERGHRAGRRRVGMCPAGSAQSGFVVAGWDGTGHSACPSTSSVCTGTGALGAQRAGRG